MFTFAALIAAAWVLGQFFARPAPGYPASARAALRLAAGFCFGALVALVVGSWSLDVASVLLYATASGGLFYEVARSGRTPTPRPAGPDGDTPRDFVEKVAFAATCAAVALAFLSASAPVTHWDALTEHLALPSDYARAGHIHWYPGSVHAARPHLVHALYTQAFYNGGEMAVSWLNWFFGLLGCVLVFHLGRRVAGRTAGYVAAALFAVAPVFMNRATAPSPDLPFAVLATGALLALTVWFQANDRRALVLAALLAGSACGIRHAGYLVCALLLLGTLLGSRRRRLTATLVFAGVAAAAAAPWVARTWLVTGGAVFPLGPSLFPEPEAEISVRGLPGLLRFPWDIVMRPEDHDGWAMNPGGLLLVLGVPGLFVGGRRVRWLGLYSGAGAAVYSTWQRLACPMLPFFIPMMVAAGAAFTGLPRWRRPLAALLCAAFAYHLGLQVAATHTRVPVLAGMQTREAYLRRNVEGYAALEHVNQAVGAGTILTPDPRTYYLAGDTFYRDHHTLLHLAGQSREEQYAWLREHDIRYVLVPWTLLEESPEPGAQLIPMFRRWAADGALFRVVEEVEVARLRGPGLERVTVLMLRGAP